MAEQAPVARAEASEAREVAWRASGARLVERGEWRVVYGIIVLLVLGGFLFQIRSVLSPFVLFFLLLFLVWPYAGTRLHVTLVIASSLLVTFWVLETTGFLLAPFILALGLAYVLNPAVELLERKGVPRVLAIVVVALPFLAILLVAIIFGIPAIVNQIEDLIQNAPTLVRRVATWFENLRARLTRLDLPVIEEDVLLAQLNALTPEQVTAFLQQQQGEIIRRIWGGVLGVGRGVGTVLTILGYVVLTPVLTFYLLRDYNGITARLAGLIPRGNRTSWLAFLGEYNLLLARYLRGQVLAAAAVGVLTWLGLFALGFPYSGLVAAVAGVFNLIPYLGLIVSLIPAFIISLLSGSVLISLLKVAVVFVVVQLLDSTVVGPRIVGGSVGLHPVWVILAIVVGGSFFGLVGLLLAVPVAVLVKLLLRGALDRYRHSGVFLGASPAEGSGADAGSPNTGP